MRTRRGIEPIVAAILLIVITVVAAVLLYMWFNGYLSTTTSKVSQISAPEELQIVGVNMQSSSSMVVYVQNVGPIPVVINQAYILNATTLNVVCVPAITYYSIPPSASSVPATSGVTLSTNQAAAIYLNLTGCNLTPNQYYVIKLVTARGTQVTYQFST